jgi:hypothetical protein
MRLPLALLFLSACSTSSTPPPALARQASPPPEVAEGRKRLLQADGGFVGYTDASLVYPAGLQCGLHLRPTADGRTEWAPAYFHGIYFASGDCTGQAFLDASGDLVSYLVNCFGGGASGPYYQVRQPIQAVPVDVYSTLEGQGCNRRTYHHALPVYALDAVAVPPPPAFPLSLSAR